MRVAITLFLILFTLITSGQAGRKSCSATRIQHAPRIDGLLNDACWVQAEAATGFTQYLPLYNIPPSFPTEVKVLYDDQALYIGARMTDPYPDSIPVQLGNRDDENMNADYFAVEFDTYNNQLDGYTFIVTAAGVQVDSRESDETYDGVWMSEVKMQKDGWTAELRIPYSAIRFPNIPDQVWGLQFIRSVRRYREFDHWSLEKPGAENTQVYWGELKDIKNIRPPLRLSVTPYLAVAAEHYPDSAGRDISTSFVGGMDLKYGINESFTLDMTLLPDFSQVKSDNKVKNLTAFETIYSEQRPFFKEAVDLFEKGDLFYSRRIGQTPARYYEILGMADENMKIIKNPVQQRLVNATKVSGRTPGGLAVGLLNAVTANTYATLEDQQGTRQEILTDPASNYNVLVLAQALKNNSELFISNTNLLRGSGYDDANSTAAGIKLNDKKNTYVVNLNGGVSQNFHESPANGSNEVRRGYKAFAGLGKTNGNFQFTLVKGAMSPEYDANSMGITIYNNYHYNYASFSYNLYKPWWKLRDFHNYLILHNENNFSTGKVQSADLQLKSFGTTMKYLTIWLEGKYTFMNTYDYYEPRVANRYYLIPESWAASLGTSSDYRRKFALDMVVNYGRSGLYNSNQYGVDIHPILRVNDHFLCDYIFSYDGSLNQVGYADKLNTTDSIIFGKRDVTVFTNTISGKYLFRNNLSLNLNARHYLANGKYHSYFRLQEDGRLTSCEYTGNQNFNFNVFTIDMVFSWIFSPGSSLNIVWKNAINPPDGSEPDLGYFRNLRNTFDSPQSNILSVKVLYYLDYLQLRKKPKN